MKKLLAIILTLCIALLMCSACQAETTNSNSSNDSSPASSNVEDSSPASSDVEDYSDVTLEIWLSSFVSEEEKKISQDQWAITGIINDFCAAHDGLTINLTIPDDQRTSLQTFKAAASSGSAPDIVNFWGGSALTSIEPFLLHLDEYVSEDDFEHIIGWDTNRYEMNPTGAILGYPAKAVDVSTLYYNRDILAECGLDFDAAPPASLQELYDACEVLKGKGYVPIECNDLSGYGGIISSTLGMFWTQLSGVGRVYSNSTGETLFAEDEGFIRVLGIAAEMYQKGYLNQDYSTSTDGIGKFVNGNCAMVVGGNWDVNSVDEAMGDKAGILVMPVITSDSKTNAICLGGAGQALSVSSQTKYPELCVEFISYLSSKECTLRLPDMVSIPIRDDITKEELGISGKALLEKCYEMGQHYDFWLDNAMDSTIVDDYTRIQQQVVIGEMTPEDAAAELDKKVVEYKTLG